MRRQKDREVIKIYHAYQQKYTKQTEKHGKKYNF